VSGPTQGARELFGSALPQAEAYARLLAGPGVERGIIGPAEAERIWDRHLINSGLIAPLLPDAERPLEIADLGSGAGLPGFVLAILRPDARVVLIEPMARRTTFLLECVAELGLTNVTVRRGRAEELTGEIEADVVTSRAVARLDRLAVLAAGLSRPGGLVLAIKGASATEELEQARPALQRIGATEIAVVWAGSDLAWVSRPTTVIRFRTASSPSSRRRRRPQAPGKR